MTYKFFNKYDYLTPLSVKSNEATIVYDSINLRRKVVKKNAQRYEFTITVSAGRGNTLHADLMSWWTFHGMDRPFAIDVPQPLYTDELTVASQPISVTSNYSVSNSEIAITSSAPFKIPPGRFITFSNHNKLYTINYVLDNVLKISPGLVKPISVGTIVNVSNVKATVLNEADNSLFSYESGVIQTATLKFIEDLN